MTPDQIDGYRRAIKQQDGSPDGKVLVDAADLRALLDCWQWFQEDRPRIRRQAKTEAQSVGWLETRFTEVK